jgi:hypothetical protein
MVENEGQHFHITNNAKKQVPLTGLNKKNRLSNHTQTVFRAYETGSGHND